RRGGTGAGAVVSLVLPPGAAAGRASLRHSAARPGGRRGGGGARARGVGRRRLRGGDRGADRDRRQRLPGLRALPGRGGRADRRLSGLPLPEGLMKAVILALGPESLLVVGGVPLVVRAARALRAAGVAEIGVVAGSRAEEVARRLVERGV